MQVISALSFAPSAIYRVKQMSQIGQAKAEVAEIAAGLKKLGPDRVVALSTHKAKELVVELESKTARLMAILEGVPE